MRLILENVTLSRTRGKPKIETQTLRFPKQNQGKLLQIAKEKKKFPPDGHTQPQKNWCRQHNARLH